MSKIMLADYLPRILCKHGVNHVFMITGGGAIFLNNGFGKCKNIKYICNHHEQASAIAAEGYARVNNNLGVCVVTTGPGGTNTITGVVGSWLDSIPTLVISGQAKRENLMRQYPGIRQLGIQEVDVVTLVKSITKYAVLIDNPDTIEYELEKAIYLAKSGRQGPVWIDIPLDVQSSIIDTNNLKKFDPKKEFPDKKSANIKEQIKKVIDLIKKAKRPVIIAGQGIRLSEGVDLFYRLISKLKIPVVTPMVSNDLIESNHPLYAGRFGIYAERGGNFTVQNADLIIVIEARLTITDTGYKPEQFAREATKVVIDIDKTEFTKPIIKPDIAINSTAKEFMEQLFDQLKESKTKLPDVSEWTSLTKKWQKKYHIVLPEYRKQKKYVNFYHVIELLGQLTDQGEIVVTGNGAAYTGTAQSLKIKKKQRLIYNVNLASMGYDLPAAIGAYFASNRDRIILITGDGSIMMNLQELLTIVNYKIPIKIFVFNNKGYLSIRTTQKNFFKGDFVGSCCQSGLTFPDFCKLARINGIKSLRIKSRKNLKAKLKKVLNSKGPVLCEIMMNPDEQMIPKMATVMDKTGKLVSTPIEDQYPLLPRDEFMKNMIIKPLNQNL